MNERKDQFGTRLVMPRRSGLWILAVVVWTLTALAWVTPREVLAQGAAHVDIAVFNTSVDTFTAGYIERALGVAKDDGAQALIIELDTPGGELDATHEIDKALLGSPVPSVVYIYPAGSRAGSAGTFITYASTVAAMAPGTNIGAAHPVDMSGGDITGTIGTKVVNDAIADIRSMARTRGRNEEWAARAVSESVSIPAEEALNMHVIDLIAQDRQDLLNKLDGRTVSQNGHELTLHTRGASIREVNMTVIEDFLHVLLDPNIAAILLSIGSLAILVELYNPGAMIPAITGVICLTLALVGLYNLPTNWAAVVLIGASIIMFVLDVKLTSFVLTLGAIVAFVLGAAFLFRPFTPPEPITPEFSVTVSPFVIAALTLLMTGFFLIVVRAAIRSRLLPVVTGVKPYLDAYGVATSELTPNGTVRVKSEDWSATAENPPIHKGDRVKVTAVEGLHMRVMKID